MPTPTPSILYFLLPALGAALRVSHAWDRPVAGLPSQLMLALWDGMFLITDSSSALSKTGNEAGGLLGR